MTESRKPNAPVARGAAETSDSAGSALLPQYNTTATIPPPPDPARAEATHFLRALYGDNAPGWCPVFLLPARVAHWIRATDLERIADTGLQAANRGQNVYVPVGLQAERMETGRGTAATVCALAGLWADIDYQSPAHKTANLPPTESDALTLLAELPLEPTALVHSGHGLQAWWLFREPWTFDSDAERLAAAELSERWQATIHSIAARHGWAVDATADLARVLRLPGTVNRKEGCEPVPVRLLSLDDANRYTLDDFEPYLADVPDSRGNGRKPAVSDAIPAGQRNATLTSLAGTMRRRGMGESGILAALLAENAAKCDPPLAEAEIRRIAHSVAGYEPAEPEPAKREADSGGKPRINAGIRDLEAVSGQAWAAIVAANNPPYMFRHSGRPVRLEHDREGHLALRELTPERLRHEADRAAVWYRRERAGDGWAEVDAAPPKDTVADMLAYPAERMPLPYLERIALAPTFAPDGTLLRENGYHTPSGTLVRLAFPAPPVPSNPTGADVAGAVDAISELVGDFPFVGDADRTHAVALLLLPFVRDLIEGPTPLHLIEAPSAGTGKGLLAAALLAPAAGGDIGLMTQGRDEDEWRKRITTRLREGKAAILIDNVNRPLDSGTLSSALTAWPLWGDRQLGTLEAVNVPVRCAWVATGNNPTLSTEIARRSIRIRLDAKMDRPWERETVQFHHPNLWQWASDHRAELAGAALTLAQAWLRAGRPAPQARPLGSYEAWSHVVGGILEHAGYRGFLSNLGELYERADTEGAVWRRFVEAWWETHKDAEVGVADLYPIAESMEDFDLGKGQERAQKTVLGKALGQRRDMVIGGYRIESVGTQKRIAQYRLVSTGKY